MRIALEAVFPVFALILAGYLCGRKNLFGPGATSVLNKFVVYLAFPALLFNSVLKTPESALANSGFAAAFGIGMFATYALSFILNRPVHPRLTDCSIEGLAAATANTGFMGFPLCIAALGNESLPAAIIATLFTSSLLVAFSVTLIEIDLQKGTDRWRTTGKVLSAVLRNPLVFAPAIGFMMAIGKITPPLAFMRLTESLAGAASPGALITIGLFLAQKQAAAPQRITVTRLVLLKLFFQPVLTGFLAVAVFHLSALWVHAAVLLSALPIGTGPFMIAKLYEREAAPVSRAILLSTIGSLISVSLIIMWANRRS